MYERSMIERHSLLYFFLCIVPFFNIIALHSSISIVLAITTLFILFNFAVFKTKSIDKTYIFYLLIFFTLISILLISQIFSLLTINSSNMRAIRFFGMFLPISIFLIFIYNIEVLLKKYLDRILSLYIIFFSLSICIDYYILHSSLDISLQPMYREEDWSYMARPFGITGQPSVNSVLLVFFYTFWLSLEENKNDNKQSALFFLVTLGIFHQVRGSGYIAYKMLMVSMIKNVSVFFKLFVFMGILTGIVLTLANYELLDKISYEYISAMISVFSYQIQDWLDLVNQNFYGFFLFGGISSNIDFGPLYFISNVGFIYFICFVSLFIYLILISRNHYERMSIYILLVGNLHYPVIFYLVMAFILPIFIIKILNNVNSKKKELSINY